MTVNLQTYVFDFVLIVLSSNKIHYATPVHAVDIML